MDQTNSGVVNPINGSSIWSSVGQAGVTAAGSAAAASQVANANANAASGVQTATTAGQGLLNPYATTGSAAETQLSNLYGLNGAGAEAGAQAAFENTPGYQFTKQAGTQAIQRQASATGGEFSSATLGALDQYNTGLAQQTYQNYVQNLFGLVQPGASAASASGNLGLAGATQSGKFQVGQGAASASGILGATGAASNLLGNPAVQSGVQSLFNPNGGYDPAALRVSGGSGNISSLYGPSQWGPAPSPVAAPTDPSQFNDWVVNGQASSPDFGGMTNDQVNTDLQNSLQMPNYNFGDDAAYY